jgi:hypothetical protein
LYNTHIAVDKARNLVVDNTYLRGLLLLKKGPNVKSGVPPLTVMHPIAYVAEGYDVIAQNMQSDIEDFIRLDQFISGLAEIQIGAFLPGEALGRSMQAKTASEVNRIAAIEGQIREGILMRFVKQYSKSVERMQRGICHPEHVKAAAELKTALDMAKLKSPNAVWAKKEVVAAFEKSTMELPSFLVPFDVPEHLDEDAISCCLSMMDRNLPPSDILLMAHSAAEELLPDTLAQEEAILDLLIQRYTGNPAINQDELIKLDWSRKVGESIANSVILPKDQVEALAIEATRQQVIELQSMIAGQDVPVSPRDNDMVHLQTMAEKLFPLISQAPEGSLPPEMVAPFMSALRHFTSHLQQAEVKGGNRQILAQMKQAVKQAFDHLTKGMAVPPPPELQPAAAVAQGSGPSPKRVSTAQVKEVNKIASEEMPSQFGAVAQVATPPKPPTAG